MTSFQRQLNLYGFSRLTAGTDRGGYVKDALRIAGQRNSIHKTHAYIPFPQLPYSTPQYKQILP